MGPFKCPDCGVWWAGFEHRCHLQYGSGTDYTFTPGHCHGCSTVVCQAADHVPCLQHMGGWTTSIDSWTVVP